MHEYGTQNTEMCLPLHRTVAYLIDTFFNLKTPVLNCTIFFLIIVKVMICLRVTYVIENYFYSALIVSWPIALVIPEDTNTATACTKKKDKRGRVGGGRKEWRLCIN